MKPNLRVVELGDDWWAAGVRAAIETLAAEGRDFTIEDVRALGVPEPDHSNRWGAALNSAALRGTITMVSLTRSRRASRHGGRIGIWRGTRAAA